LTPVTPNFPGELSGQYPTHGTREGVNLRWLDAPTSILLSGKRSKIIWFIIKAVAIDVVRVFIWSERAAQTLFQQEASIRLGASCSVFVDQVHEAP
jgi:hypothetical protein